MAGTATAVLKSQRSVTCLDRYALAELHLVAQRCGDRLALTLSVRRSVAHSLCWLKIFPLQIGKTFQFNLARNSGGFMELILIGTMAASVAAVWLIAGLYA